VKIDGKELIELRLGDAYEFMSKMHYTDNWSSEMHEEFGFWSFSMWKKQLGKIGFKVREGSKPFQSRYIIDKMYRGHVTLYQMKNNKLSPIDYPPTNMILAAEKPKASH
jgi:hypothetical protein